MCYNELKIEKELGIMVRKFDLNIELMLENWSVDLAIREIIANALDEQLLSKSNEVKIFKDSKGDWHIRDFGRGLKYTHLTQNENEEKLNYEGLIGRFGVGLKDALAVFYRHDIEVEILSKHGRITLGKEPKHGFEDIVTLHAYVQPYEQDFIGTDFILKGCQDEDIDIAKEKFLKFKALTQLDQTAFGDIYLNEKGPQGVYINGILIAEEEEFLFSYNITSLTKKIKKALNRERTNVGRVAYSDRVKEILLKAKAPAVIDALMLEIKQANYQEPKYEVNAWKDVKVRIIKFMNHENCIFLTTEELSNPQFADYIEDSKRRGCEIITITGSMKDTLSSIEDLQGNKINTIEVVAEVYNAAFEYEFVSYEQLTEDEKATYQLKDQILEMCQVTYFKDYIYISEKLKEDSPGLETIGVYDRANGRIIIKRSELRSPRKFLAVLLHEVVHAKTGYSDVSRPFESSLTELIGLLAEKAILAKSEPQPASNTTELQTVSNQIEIQHASSPEDQKSPLKIDEDKKPKKSIFSWLKRN